MVVAHGLPQHVPRIHIQSRGGLIQQHNPRLPDDGERHGKASLLTSREPSCLPRGQIGQPKHLHHLTARHGIGEVTGDEVDHLADPEGCRQPGLLRRGAQPNARLGIARIAAKQADRSRGGGAQTRGE